VVLDYYQRQKRLLQHDYQSDLEKVLLLMSLCPRFKDMRLSGIQRIIIPPLRLGQYRLYNDKEVPSCFISWGFLSDSVSEAYKQNKHKLQVEDWNSGNNFWIINVLCPNGGVLKAIRRLDIIRKEDGWPSKVNFKRLGSKRVKNVERI